MKYLLFLILMVLLYKDCKCEEIKPVEPSEFQRIQMMCEGFRSRMKPDVRLRLQKSLRKATTTDEILEAQQIAGVPKECAEADNY